MTTKIKRSRATNAADLLLDVAEAILEEPKRYNQSTWLAIGVPGIQGWAGTYPSCGTIGCRAGWIVALSNPPARTRKLTMHFSIADTAREILAMSQAETKALFAEDAVPGEPQTSVHALEGARGLLAFRKQHLARLTRKKV